MRRFVPFAFSVLFVVSTRVPAADLPRVPPEQVGFRPSELGAVQTGLEKLVAGNKIPGALVLIARHGKVAYVTTVGCRDLAKKTPMTEDTIFAIASMTKPITCVAAMMLVEEGKLGLDDPVEKYLPEFKELRVLASAKDDTAAALATAPAKEKLLIRHLFSHTAGFSYGFPMMGGETEKRMVRAYSKFNASEGKLKTISELPAVLVKLPLAHEPGEGWTYGLSHDVLGRVIEVVSGEPLDQFMNQRIFVPLDMTDTSFQVPEAKRDRVATVYSAGSSLSALPKSFGSATYFSGGGGLFSTAHDFSRFAQMLLNGGEFEGKRVIKKDSLALMTSNQIGKHMAFGLLKYGLGFGLVNAPAPGGGKPGLDYYFWGGAYSTSFWVDPRRDVIGVLMTQVLPPNQAVERMVHQAVNKAVEN